MFVNDFPITNQTCNDLMICGVSNSIDYIFCGILDDEKELIF